MRFKTFRVMGVIQGQHVMILINGRENHRFIQLTLVSRRGIPIEVFEGFSVEVASGCTFPCMKKVLWFNVEISNYSMTNDLYVIELVETNVVLGFQWLSTLGKISQNYQTMKMGITAVDGK